MSAKLQVLDQTLYLAHISTAEVSSCFRTILKATMFPDRVFSINRNGFFSVTSAQEDPGLSLVVDEFILESLPQNQIVIGPELRAIKVFEGSDAISKKILMIKVYIS